MIIRKVVICKLEIEKLEIGNWEVETFENWEFVFCFGNVGYFISITFCEHGDRGMMNIG